MLVVLRVYPELRLLHFFYLRIGVQTDIYVVTHAARFHEDVSWGFERECAQEITDAAGMLGVSGFVKARENSGFAVFIR